jgi:hypothetical protein
MTPCEPVGIVSTSESVVRSRIEKCELTASSMTPTTAQWLSGVTATLYGCCPLIGIDATSACVATSTTATWLENTHGASAYCPFGVTATCTGRFPTATVCVAVRAFTSKKVRLFVALCAITTAEPSGRIASSWGPSPSGGLLQERNVLEEGGRSLPLRPRGSTRCGRAR